MPARLPPPPPPLKRFSLCKSLYSAIMSPLRLPSPQLQRLDGISLTSPVLFSAPVAPAADHPLRSAPLRGRAWVL